MSDHARRLRAMIEPDQQTWDLSPADVRAIRWALDRVVSLEQVVAQQRYQMEQLRYHVDVGIEARADAKALRDGMLRRWERSLQEVIDVAERAKRKVSLEAAS